VKNNAEEGQEEKEWDNRTEGWREIEGRKRAGEESWPEKVRSLPLVSNRYRLCIPVHGCAMFVHTYVGYTIFV